MSEVRIPVYFMPGMAASPDIFEYINLPVNQFEIHLLKWDLPFKEETLSDYALRLTTHIKHENCVLVGVSFGGILVQEMSKHIKVIKLIIISSVKLSNELPNKMLLAKTTMAYKLLPTGWVSNLSFLDRFSFGNYINKRLVMYRRYLSVDDSGYLNWAIKEMVCWNQETYRPDIIHIHGDKDVVFPIKNISNCIILKGGTHGMIISKYRWFNENLPKLILDS